MTASMIVEIFHKSTISSEYAAELFQLLEQSLHKLSDSKQHFLTVESFKLNLLQQIGALPDLQKCGSCHNRWTSTDKILIDSAGHFRCQNCAKTPDPTNIIPSNIREEKPIEFNIIKLIHYLTQLPNAQTKTIVFNAQQQEQLRHITQFFLQHFLEREIVSERILTEFKT